MKNIFSFSVNHDLYETSSSLILEAQKSTKFKCLLSHKVFIEGLLKSIKEFLSDFISVISNKKIDNNLFAKTYKNSFKLYKNIICSFKNCLELINIEKSNELKLIKKEKDLKDSQLYELKKYDKYHNKFKLLKDLNFQYENEIIKYNNLIAIKTKIMFLYTNYECFLELFDEHFFRETKKLKEIEDLLREECIIKRNILIKKEIEFINIEKKIERIKAKLNSLKICISEKNYINHINFFNRNTKENSITN